MQRFLLDSSSSLLEGRELDVTKIIESVVGNSVLSDDDDYCDSDGDGDGDGSSNTNSSSGNNSNVSNINENMTGGGNADVAASINSNDRYQQLLTIDWANIKYI